MKSRVSFPCYSNFTVDILCNGAIRYQQFQEDDNGMFADTWSKIISENIKEFDMIINGDHVIFFTVRWRKYTQIQISNS